MFSKFYFNKETSEILRSSGYLDAHTSDMIFDKPTFRYSSGENVTVSTIDIMTKYRTFRQLYNGKILQIPILLNFTVAKDELPSGNKAYYHEVDTYDGVELGFKCLDILKDEIIKSIEKLKVEVELVDKGATLQILPVVGNEYVAKLSGAVYIKCLPDNLITEDQFNTIIGSLCSKISNDLYDNVTTIRKYLKLFPRKL